MGEAISKLLDWLKSPRQTAIVFVACVVLLALPDSSLARLGLLSLVRYRGYVSVAALISGAALVIEGVAVVWRKRSLRRRERAQKSQREDHLHKLSPEEKGILLKYLDGSSDTQYLLMNDGNVGALRGKHILYVGAKTGQMTPRGPMFAVNIQPWAKEYLLAHPELLGSSESPSRPPNVFRTWGSIRRDLEDVD